MLQRRLRQLLAVAFAVSVFTGMAVAPVAASQSIDLGGSEGVSIGTDGISLGGEEGVNVGVDTDSGGINASVGGESGAEVGVGAEDGVSLGAGGQNVSVGPDGVSGPGGSSDLGGGGLAPVSGGSPLGGVTEQANLLSGGDTGVQSVSGSGDSGLGIPTGPTDLGHDTDNLPVQPLTQVLQAVPTTDAVGPEDSPIGDERAQVNICDPLNIQPSEDLPVGAIPGPSDLPFSVPGVPTDIITTGTVLGIVFGLVPAPCEVFNPSDPQIDPTNLSDEPRSNLDIAQFGQSRGGAAGIMYYDGTLNESGDGPSITGKSANLITPEFGDIDQKLVLNDGRNDYGVEPRLRYNEDGFSGEAVLVLLGKNAGVGGSCENIQEYQPSLTMEELQENPLGPCEYSLVGLPNLVGPSELVGILSGLANQDGGLPVNLDALPVNPDALLNA